MAKKLKNKRNRYNSRYQLGGLQMNANNQQLQEQALLNQQGSGVLPNQQLRPQMFQDGGMPDWLYKARGRAMKKKMQGGGMYTDNTLAAAGQGRGQTANIVYAQSDPKILEQRREHVAEVEADIRKRGEETVGEAERITQEGEMLGQQAAIETAADIQQKAAGYEQAAKVVSGAPARSKAALSAGVQAFRAAQLANKAQKAWKAGSGFFKVSQGGKTIGGFGAVGPKTLAGTGSGIGAGLKGFLSSGAGLGLLASGAGYGVSKLWGDDDPTTATAADIGGSALSAAGTGMAIGSVIPGIGTAVGGIVGGLYGAGKSIFGAKKAKKEQERLEREARERKTKMINKYNKSVVEQYTTAKSAQRASAMKAKEYSGYDIGRNVSYRGGGMNLGMPRYGYAA